MAVNEIDPGVRSKADVGSKWQRAMWILQNGGVLRLLELSALSVSEPFRTWQLRAAVAADARLASEKIRSGSRGRGLFIDCGSNVGQGYRFFSRHYTPDLYDYILVEPNVECISYLKDILFEKDVNAEIINKAASTRNGRAKLYAPGKIHDDPVYEGYSIVENHNSGLGESHRDHEFDVEIFSLSDLIKEKSQNFDVIVLKMDVEGAEREILCDFLLTGAHKFLFASYVEFHSVYLSGEHREECRAIESGIVRTIKADGRIFRAWI
jgi:FkbM family methyltransferase